MEAISPKARDVLTTIGEPTATPERRKGQKATKPRGRRGALLASDSRKQKLIEMVNAGASLSSIGEALGGYEKGGVARAISKLKEAGELEE